MAFTFCKQWGLSIGLLSGLTACDSYQVTLNEAVVYNPPPLLTRFNTADSQLRHCLDQAIRDSHITAPEQLQRLECSHAQISSVEGLALFSELEELNLADNSLSSATPLLDLPQLQQVELRHNPQLVCETAQPLAERLGENLQLPVHCR